MNTQTNSTPRRLALPCLRPVAGMTTAMIAAMVAIAPPSLAQEATNVLDTVVVTADRTEASLREVSSNVTVLSQERIQASTANTLDQLMSQEGFQVISQGTQKSLFIRGMGQSSLGTEMQSRVLVLLNGRRIGANNAALMGLDKDNIERVEIIRGPAAVQYGSSAMGGVVNIITKRGEEGLRGSLEVGLGSYNLHKEALTLNGAAKGFDVSLGVTQSGRDAYEVSGGDKWAHTDIGSQASMNLDMGYTFAERHRISANFSAYEVDDAEFPDDGWSATGPQGSTYNNNDLSNRNLALMYEGASPEKTFDWFARYSFGRDRQERDPRHSSWGGMPSTTDLDNQAFTAQAGYNGSIFSLDLGLDYLKYKLKPQGEDSSESKDTAGYFTGKLRLLDEMLILSAGGRYDHFTVSNANGETKDNNFAPSVGLAFLPLEWLKFRANYAEGFRMPAPNEFLGDSTWYAANKDLSPEKSKTFELGADVNYKAFTAGLTYFHTKWDDKIVAQYAPALSQYQYLNLDNCTIAGLEFTAGLDIGQAAGWDFTLRPYLSLTYLIQRDNGDAAQVLQIGSDTLPNTPRSTVTYGIDFRHEAYSLAVNLNAVYFSDILTSDYRAGSPTNGKYVTDGDGTVVNMSLEKGLYEWQDHGRLKLRLEINNIFDDDNEFYLDYPGPGRNFYAGLRYEF